MNEQISTSDLIYGFLRTVSSVPLSQTQKEIPEENYPTEINDKMVTAEIIGDPYFSADMKGDGLKKQLEVVKSKTAEINDTFFKCSKCGSTRDLDSCHHPVTNQIVYLCVNCDATRESRKVASEHVRGETYSEEEES